MFRSEKPVEHGSEKGNRFSGKAWLVSAWLATTPMLRKAQKRETGARQNC